MHMSNQVLDAIGNTSLVELRRVVLPGSARNHYLSNPSHPTSHELGSLGGGYQIHSSFSSSEGSRPWRAGRRRPSVIARPSKRDRGSLVWDAVLPLEWSV